MKQLFGFLAARIGGALILGVLLVGCLVVLLVTVTFTLPVRMRMARDKLGQDAGEASDWLTKCEIAGAIFFCYAMLIARDNPWDWGTLVLLFTGVLLYIIGRISYLSANTQWE